MPSNRRSSRKPRARQKGGIRVDGNVVGALAGIADGFRRMVIECNMCTGHIGQVGGDVFRADFDLAVLHVLGMNEQNISQHVEMLPAKPHEPDRRNRCV